MKYEVVLSGRAKRDLRSLPKEIVIRLDSHIIELADNSRPKGCKKLRGQTPDGWRIRVGDYRILYRIDDDANRIIIYRLGHRRDVYG